MKIYLKIKKLKKKNLIHTLKKNELKEEKRINKNHFINNEIN
jgi:hypothetical protein